MKFSDLVVLGSTTVHFDPTIFLMENCGCLIGMAVSARTGAETMYPGEIQKLFPWLWKDNECQCPVCHDPYKRYAGSISCLAGHVERGYPFEKALEYIRSIEPADEEENSTTAFGQLSTATNSTYR